MFKYFTSFTKLRWKTKFGTGYTLIFEVSATGKNINSHETCLTAAWWFISFQMCLVTISFWIKNCLYWKMKWEYIPLKTMINRLLYLKQKSLFRIVCETISMFYGLYYPFWLSNQVCFYPLIYLLLPIHNSEKGTEAFWISFLLSYDFGTR